MKQLSIFLKNQPGELSRLMSQLISNNTSIIAMSITDTNENGILRMVVDKPDKTFESFISNDINCYLSNVVVVKITDARELDKLFKLFSANELNVEYLYTYKESYFIIKIENIEKAEDLLVRESFNIL